MSREGLRERGLACLLARVRQRDEVAEKLLEERNVVGNERVVALAHRLLFGLAGFLCSLFLDEVARRFGFGGGVGGVGGVGGIDGVGGVGGIGGVGNNGGIINSCNTVNTVSIVRITSIHNITSIHRIRGIRSLRSIRSIRSIPNSICSNIYDDIRRVGRHARIHRLGGRIDRHLLRAGGRKTEGGREEARGRRHQLLRRRLAAEVLRVSQPREEGEDDVRERVDGALLEELRVSSGETTYGRHAPLERHIVHRLDDRPCTSLGERNAGIAADTVQNDVQEVLVDGFFGRRVGALKPTVA